MIDIGLYNPNELGIGQQQLITTASSGREVTGPEKLAQRFLLKLLKEPESSTYFTDGCHFLTELKSNILTEFDVFSAFASALSEIDPLMRAEEAEDTSGDERFSGAAIIQLKLGADEIILSIAVFNQAGDAIGVRLPMEVS